MKVLTLSQIIGETIDKVRYSYQIQNEYRLQEFHSYWKLSNGIIIDFPCYDNEVLLELNEENIDHLFNCFKSGNELLNSVKNKIEGKKIEDIYFCYNQAGIANDKNAYLKLNNGFYITEINFGPPGISVDLLVFNKQEFWKRIECLGENIKSYIEEIKNR